MNITFEKLLIRGERYFRLLEFSGILPMSELPTEYLNGSDYMYLCTYGITEKQTFAISGNDKDIKYYHVGSTIGSDEFNLLLKKVKTCVKNYRMINARIKADKPVWDGRVSYDF